MTPRIYRTGPDHFAGSRPSTDADRLRKHGPIQSMEPATAWDLIKSGMPGGIGMAVLFAVATIGFVGLGL